MLYVSKTNLKFLSGFALKGAVGAIAGVYLILTSFFIFSKLTAIKKNY